MKYRKGDFVRTKGIHGEMVVEIIETQSGLLNDSYLVRRFDGLGHNGNGKSIEKQRNEEFWFIGENSIDELVPASKIELVSFGGEFYGRYYENGDLVDSKNHMGENEADRFSCEKTLEATEHYRKSKRPEYVEILSKKHSHHRFKVGEIARIVEPAPYDGYTDCEIGGLIQTIRNDDLKEVKLVDREAKVGEYIYIDDPRYTFDENGDVLKIDGASIGGVPYVLGKNHPRETGDSLKRWHYSNREYKVIEGYEPINGFKPHLRFQTNDNYGVIGTETGMKDIKGNMLYVGDVVSTVSLRFDGTVYRYGMNYVVDDGEKFVMGCKGYDFPEGKSEPFVIIREKSFEDLDNGEKYGSVEAVLEDD